MKNNILYLLLAFIGGFTDANSFINFEVFTGHLTGNSILSAIYIVQDNMPLFLLSIISLICFLVGSILGAIIRTRFNYRFSRSFTLFLIVLLLLVTVMIHQYLGNTDSNTDNIINHKFLMISLVSMAMGIQNGFFNQTMGIGAHTTYITGMTTSLISALIIKTKDPLKTRNSKIILPLLISTFILGAFAGAIVATKQGLESYMLVLGFSFIAFLLSFLQDLTDQPS